MNRIAIALLLLTLPLAASSTYSDLSESLLEQVRNGQDTQIIEQKLAETTPKQLRADLNESENKAFWLNIYNAYVQILLHEDPDRFTYRDSWFGYNFFSSEQIVIAQQPLSLDDIEHGIIRRSKPKWALGYLTNPFPGSFEKQFRWKQTDPRIHFALNCGAASCPRIATYTPQHVDKQLDITSEQYLQRTTTYDQQTGTVYVNRLMSWFRGDFSGKTGAVRMLYEYGVLKQDQKVSSLEFTQYNWTLDLDEYKDI